VTVVMCHTVKAVTKTKINQNMDFHRLESFLTPPEHEADSHCSWQEPFSYDTNSVK
jgi:hypothetical protein